jgi:hypothetical protein
MLYADQLCWDVGFPNTPASVLPKYLSGEDPILLENYPEIGLYRDIVFCFKYMMLAPAENLPELRAWMPIDARLTWRYGGQGNGYEINGFDRRLTFTVDAKLDEKKAEQQQRVARHEQQIATAKTGLTGFISKLFASRIQGRGSSDASALVGEKVDDEEAVLHIRHLPSFSDRISQKDSELLISYLTVPYLRVPLCLAFFSAPERINALGSRELRTMLDGVLFEPGEWQPDVERKLPTHIPAVDKQFLATPAGLLFNELQHAPDGTRPLCCAH